MKHYILLTKKKLVSPFSEKIVFDDVSLICLHCVLSFRAATSRMLLKYLISTSFEIEVNALKRHVVWHFNVKFNFNGVSL